MNLKFSLRLLSLFFWWYLVVFLLSVLPLLGIAMPEWLIPEFRGANYAWDFELMFTTIFAIWGVYLWKASKEPQKHLMFIDFTIVATLAHIGSMILVGYLRTEDLLHMLNDAVALTVPILFVLATRFRKVER